jgi:hypothetical protein
VFGGLLPAGPSQIVWDGTTPAGLAPPGTYEAVVLVNGLFGATRHALTFGLQ